MLKIRSGFYPFLKSCDVAFSVPCFHVVLKFQYSRVVKDISVYLYLFSSLFPLGNIYLQASKFNMIAQRFPYNSSTYHTAILTIYSNYFLTHSRTDSVALPSLNDIDMQATTIQEVANRLADIGDEVAQKYGYPCHVGMPSSRFATKAGFQAILFLIHCPDWIDL